MCILTEEDIIILRNVLNRDKNSSWSILKEIICINTDKYSDLIDALIDHYERTGSSSANSRMLIEYKIKWENVSADDKLEYISSEGFDDIFANVLKWTSQMNLNTDTTYNMATNASHWKRGYDMQLDTLLKLAVALKLDSKELERLLPVLKSDDILHIIDPHLMNNFIFAIALAKKMPLVVSESSGETDVYALLNFAGRKYLEKIFGNREVFRYMDFNLDGSINTKIPLHRKGTNIFDLREYKVTAFNVALLEAVVKGTKNSIKNLLKDSNKSEEKVAVYDVNMFSKIAWECAIEFVKEDPENTEKIPENYIKLMPKYYEHANSANSEEYEIFFDFCESTLTETEFEIIKAFKENTNEIIKYRKPLPADFIIYLSDKIRPEIYTSVGSILRKISNNVNKKSISIEQLSERIGEHTEFIEQAVRALNITPDNRRGTTHLTKDMTNRILEQIIPQKDVQNIKNSIFIELSEEKAKYFVNLCNMLKDSAGFFAQNKDPMLKTAYIKYIWICEFTETACFPLTFDTIPVFDDIYTLRNMDSSIFGRFKFDYCREYEDTLALFNRITEELAQSQPYSILNIVKIMSHILLNRDNLNDALRNIRNKLSYRIKIEEREDMTLKELSEDLKVNEDEIKNAVKACDCELRKQYGTWYLNSEETERVTEYIYRNNPEANPVQHSPNNREFTTEQKRYFVNLCDVMRNAATFFDKVHVYPEYAEVSPLMLNNVKYYIDSFKEETLKGMRAAYREARHSGDTSTGDTSTMELIKRVFNAEDINAPYEYVEEAIDTNIHLYNYATEAHYSQSCTEFVENIYNDNDNPITSDFSVRDDDDFREIIYPSEKLERQFDGDQSFTRDDLLKLFFLQYVGKNYYSSEGLPLKLPPKKLKHLKLTFITKYKEFAEDKAISPLSLDYLKLDNLLHISLGYNDPIAVLENMYRSSEFSDQISKFF